MKYINFEHFDTRPNRALIIKNGQKYLYRRLVRFVGLMKLHHIIRNKEHPATFSSNYWMLDFTRDSFALYPYPVVFIWSWEYVNHLTTLNNKVYMYGLVTKVVF